MKTLKNDELKKFMKHHNAELGQVTKDLEKAKVEYEKAMKNFVINHITSKTHFKSRFEQAYRDTRESYSWERASDFVDDILVLETMIGDEVYWLEEGQFDVEEELDEKV